MLNYCIFTRVKIKLTIMKKLTLLALFLTIVLIIFGQKNDPLFTVAFYNVENLFDLEDHPITQDEEFTPESEKAWDMEKYQKKLDDLSAVIRAIDKKELPEIIGLS